LNASESPLILIVDDNTDILFNLKLLLESKKYKVITKNSGKKAIEALSKLRALPDLIISDIMMPEMSGYEFFTLTSQNPLWSDIPFVFLTAKSTPEDIRLGKLLGADDYITKPFNEEDLLAIISGKILRNKNIKKINTKIKELLTSLKIEMRPSLSGDQKNLVCSLFVIWDDKMGPMLKNHYPMDKSFPFPLEEIGSQLFNAITSIYGYKKISKGEGILLSIENVKCKGFIYFDSFTKEDERFREKQYMISLIAPQINYFESLNIKEIFKAISKNIKKKKEWNIELYWQDILNILTEPKISNI
jgi:CheY-like chemotaxis protein